eukprot:3941956-Rhodomonas_salina.3
MLYASSVPHTPRHTSAQYRTPSSYASSVPHRAWRRHLPGIAGSTKCCRAVCIICYLIGSNIRCVSTGHRIASP